MRFQTASMALAVVVIGLAGCSSSGGSSTPASSGAAAPALTTAESACLSSVNQQTNRTDASVMGSEISEGTGLTVVHVEVPGATAPWMCEVTSAGDVQNVMFEGDEGAL